MTDEPTLPDSSKAKKLRDLIVYLAKKVIEAERPEYRFAQVASISPDGSAMVKFVGEEETHPAKCIGAWPSIPGQWVKMEGVPGDRHIVGVMEDPGIYLPDIFVSAPMFSAVRAGGGTAPVLTRWNTVPAYECLTGVFSIMSADLDVPLWWKEYRVDFLYGTTPSLGTLDILHRCQFRNVALEAGVDSALGAAPDVSADFVHDDNQGDIIQRATMLEGLTVTGRQVLTCSRVGTDALDTSPLTSWFLGVYLVRTA